MEASTLAPHAPSLTVHETAYGITTQDGHRESIQGIETRIVSRCEPGTTYQVQCFFLKRGKNGAPSTIDDILNFDVTDPHGTYRVTAEPIRLGRTSPPSSKAKGVGKRKSSKSPTPSKPVDLSADYPREGYLVRILHDGILLRMQGSSHSVEKLAVENPELFSKAAGSKKARRMEAPSLLVH